METVTRGGEASVASDNFGAVMPLPLLYDMMRNYPNLTHCDKRIRTMVEGPSTLGARNFPSL